MPCTLSPPPPVRHRTARCRRPKGPPVDGIVFTGRGPTEARKSEHAHHLGPPCCHSQRRNSRGKDLGSELGGDTDSGAAEKKHATHSPIKPPASSRASSPTPNETEETESHAPFSSSSSSSPSSSASSVSSVSSVLLGKRNYKNEVVDIKRVLQQAQEYHGFRSLYLSLFMAYLYCNISALHFEFPADAFTQAAMTEQWQTTVESERSIWDIKSLEEGGK